MAFQKGVSGNPAGRAKGARSKTTTLLKEAILQAAEAAGGKSGLIGYLTKQATEEPASFMSLLGKVLPLQVTGEGGGPVQVVIIGPDANL